MLCAITCLYYFHNPFLNYKSFNLRDRNKYIHTYISSNQFNNFQLLFSRHVVVGLHLYFKIYFVSKILLISLESVQIRGLRVVMYFFLFSTRPFPGLLPMLGPLEVVQTPHTYQALPCGSVYYIQTSFNAQEAKVVMYSL